MRKLLLSGLFILSLQYIGSAQTDIFGRGTSLDASRDFRTASVVFGRTEPNVLSTKQMAQINYNEGVGLYHKGENEAALASFESAIRLFPEYERAHYAIGMVLSDLGRLAEAENSFRHSLKLDGRNGETWFDLGLVLFRSSKPESAAAAFRQAIRFGTSAEPAGHNNLGVALVLSRKIDDGIKEIKIAAASGFPEAKSNLEILKTAVSASRKNGEVPLLFGSRG